MAQPAGRATCGYFSMSNDKEVISSQRFSGVASPFG
jgi:hypothetical protein